MRCSRVDPSGIPAATEGRKRHEKREKSVRKTIAGKTCAVMVRPSATPAATGHKKKKKRKEKGEKRKKLQVMITALTLAPAPRRNAPIDAAVPKHTVETSHGTYWVGVDRARNSHTRHRHKTQRERDRGGVGVGVECQNVPSYTRPLPAQDRGRGTTQHVLDVPESWSSCHDSNIN